MKQLVDKKGLRSAVNASIWALDKVIFTNMDVDEYIVNCDEPEAKRHNSDNKEHI